jgi:ubiquinone/menaquinone biosynthesis C-methylase UbiE
MTETSVPDDQKRRVVADFNAMAETYDALRFVQVCARRLVELAALPPGAQVLDIATGTGWAAIAAAQHVGPTGRVLGVDLAPELLERARQKVAAAGLTHVEFREGDAERLDLGTNALMRCSVRPRSFSSPTCSRRCGSGTAYSNPGAR